MFAPAATDREVFPRRRLARAFGRYRMFVLAGTTKWMPCWSNTTACAIKKPLSKTTLYSGGIARQIRPRLRDQGSGPERLMLLNLPHFNRQRNLCDGVDQQQHFPAVHRDLDLVHFPTRIFDAHRRG